jgi:hypothetical protein
MHQRPHRSTGAITAAALALLALAVACDGAGGVFVGGPNGRAVQEVLVTPENPIVGAGNTLQFQARSVMSDGDTTNNPVTWSATGGTITSGGLFTGGQTAGQFRVVARAQNGVADTVPVTVAVSSGIPTLIAIVVTPATATVGAGGTAQFSANGLLSNGSTQAVNVNWVATGGAISGTGLYTAGAVVGTFQVFAIGLGGRADTATVIIAGPGGGP